MIKSKLRIALLMASSLPIGIQANNIIESGDTSRVYDIDEIIVIDQPKEAFRLRQQPLSSTSFNGDLIRSLNVQDVRVFFFGDFRKALFVVFPSRFFILIFV